MTGELLSGRTLVLKTKAGSPAKSALSLVSKDVLLTLGAGNGSADDPTLASATVRIRSTSGGFDDTYVMPASNWSLVGKPGQAKGYKYKDPTLSAGPVKSASVKTGKALTLVGNGAGLHHQLADDPSPVDVTVTLGAHRYCLQFGGTTTWKPEKQFTARDAPAPVACAP